MQHVGSTFRTLIHVIIRISLLQVRIILVHGFLPVLVTQHRAEIYHTARPDSSVPFTNTRSPPTLHENSSSALWLQSKDAIPHEMSKETALREEASALLEKAEALRKQLPVQIQESNISKNRIEPRTSKWNVPPLDDDSTVDSIRYRLYVNIGREDGTWMDSTMGCKSTSD